MELPDNLNELEAQLDPATRVVVSLLRSSLEEQRQVAEEQRQENRKLQEQLDKLLADNAELQRLLFGKKRERLPPIQSEVRRVVEAEEVLRNESAVPEPGGSDKPSARARGRRKSEAARKASREQRKKLPVVHERIVVAAEGLPEGYTLDDFREVRGGETVRRVEHVREHLVVVEYELQTLASKDGDYIVKAQAPAGVVEGGHYGPGVYAHVVTSKCMDVLPLHRIEQMMERAGCPIARSTLCTLFHRAANLLAPIYNRLLELAEADPYVNMDETPQPVMDEGGCRRGWIWTLLSGAIIAYKFSDSRAAETPTQLLAGTEGYLQTDAYAGYNASCAEGRVRVGCWAHGRRAFYKALDTAPAAREMLDMIVELYRVEYLAAEREVLGTDAHNYLRKNDSRAVLDRMEQWLDDQKPQHPPKSPIGKAMTYVQNSWEALTAFVADPKLALDNNAAERALRIFALGRKNFMWVGHDEAGQNLAVLQTVVATCKLHDVNPYDYVKDVLIRIQTHPASQVDNLLPVNWPTVCAS